ncbi:hypothetical protein ACM26V_19490 [Salipaludibacillus sp. HK11]|uniref:hypothetical protein n=1 Tax=Salipaludibacillus sp. HK11 TaxID=3394320 RepID=UPI0039FCBB10
MKKYKIFVIDKNGNEKLVQKKHTDKVVEEMIFYTEESKINFYEELKNKYPAYSIKMMMSL